MNKRIRKKKEKQRERVAKALLGLSIIAEAVAKSQQAWDELGKKVASTLPSGMLTYKD